MENDNVTWFKWDYVCTSCDALVEMTIKSNGQPHAEICPNCNLQMTLMSVVDATIYPTNKKEEQTMETDTLSVITLKDDLIRNLEMRVENLNKSVNDYYSKEQKLRTLLNEVFADSEDQEALEQIADIFDVPLTKEIEVTAWVRVDMVIELDIREGEYDLEDLVRNNLTIDSFGSEISVNDYDVERVEEGAY